MKGDDEPLNFEVFYVQRNPDIDHQGIWVLQVLQ